jgi:16S rRNA (cytosine967-C5)-methyltransferase
MITKNPREASFLALVQLENGMWLEDFFSTWEKESLPATLDSRLAKEIAYGVTRQRLALDFISKKLVPKQNLKKKEKILFWMALYQHFFMNKIPLYANINETVLLAKKYFRIEVASFFNAVLRKLDAFSFDWPGDDSPSSLSVRYSYPLFFIEKLLDEYGLEKTKEILEVENCFFPPQARCRFLKEGEELKDKIWDGLWPVFSLTLDEMEKVATSSSYYIQNITPLLLIEKLSQWLPKLPSKILDLCAAPGGKILALFDMFPKALLTANDLPNKMALLEENKKKYQIPMKLTSEYAEGFSSDNNFDLIVLDAPCSNSGVLHKRAEARWRLTEENFQNLVAKQLAMLDHAKTLLSPNGQIWYMTCSILQEENEKIIEKVCQDSLFRMVHREKILPDREGKDGGFGCVLEKTIP